MFPDKCSITEQGKSCTNPPQFVISVSVDSEEYMVGITCEKHKEIVSHKIKILQNKGRIPSGEIGFSQLKAIGTECIHGDEDDLIHLDSKDFKN